MLPFGDRAMELLSARPGEHIVDLGCGLGTTTSRIAEEVGATGAAVGVDFSPVMCEQARELARTVSSNAAFLCADVENEPLGTYDAAFSRFGMMFFVDPVAAFTNVRSSLRDGGRLVMTTWQSALLNPWHILVARVMHGSGRLRRGDVASRTFSLDTPRGISDVLAAAGFRNVAVTAQVVDHVVPSDLLDEWVRASLTVMDLQPGRTDDRGLVDDVLSAARRRLVDDSFTVRQSAWITSADA
jgi:SAM-dependent methyltransferase